MDQERSEPWLALKIIAVVSLLVPKGGRRSWIREWRGEVIGHWEQLLAQGSSGSAAHFDVAMRALGSVADAIAYDGGRWSTDAWAQDLKVAVRGLVRRPRFSILIAVTLAVGIGANTALFGLAKDVLLRPFPYPDPDRVVAVEGYSLVREGFTGNVTYPNLADLEETSTTLSAIAAIRLWSPALEDDRGSIVVRGATVTADFFGVLGVTAGQGRFFRPDEEGSGRTPLVVLSHTFWVDHFGADPSVVGRVLRLSGEPHEVIGITGPDYEDPWLGGGPGEEPQLWRTVASPPSEWPRSGRSWRGIARVRSEVTIEAAQDELDNHFAGLIEAYPEANANRTMRLIPVLERIAGP